MSIPKVIHYCWFGKNAKGKLVEDCIASWHARLPDYKMIEWNETNYTSTSFFFNACISQKKYAFASDYARFDILEKHGGIYLDTDMLLLKSLDELLEHNCFFGYETEHYISCGIIGTLPHEKFIKEILKKLDAVNSALSFKGYTIVQVVSAVYNDLKGQNVLPFIYPVDYFYPYPYTGTGDPLSYQTPNTIAIHLWNATWFSDIQRAQLLYSQGRKREARFLYIRSLFKKPQYIRYLLNYLK